MVYNRYTPVYNKKLDYNTNALSYYDYLAKVNEFLKMMGIQIEEYDGILAKKLLDINTRLDEYLKAWDKNLEAFPDNVEILLQQWMGDGTLDHIINETIFNDLNTEIDNVEVRMNNNLSELYQELEQIGTTRFIRN